jgi:hypothetical protein
MNKGAQLDLLFPKSVIRQPLFAANAGTATNATANPITAKSLIVRT